MGKPTDPPKDRAEDRPTQEIPTTSPETSPKPSPEPGPRPGSKVSRTPPQWRGLGDPRRRPRHGKIYRSKAWQPPGGRATQRARRVRRGLLWLIVALLLASAGVMVVAAAGLLRVLIL